MTLAGDALWIWPGSPLNKLGSSIGRLMEGRNEGKKEKDGGGWGLGGRGVSGNTGQVPSPPSCPVTLGKRHFSTPAQMLLHCLELQPNGEQALISYCLPLTVDPCDKCSSRCYTAMPKKSTSDGSKKEQEHPQQVWFNSTYSFSLGVCKYLIMLMCLWVSSLKHSNSLLSVSVLYMSSHQPHCICHKSRS